MKTSLAVAVLAAALAACSKEPAPPSPPVPPVPVVTAPGPAAAPAAEAPPVEPKPAAHPQSRPPAPGLSSVHGKVGDAKCRMCHKLQHDSWSATPHARKGLDCEGCHGGGRDFTKVMRDRTAAIAAGLLIPTSEFCKTCHKTDWQDGMLLRIHAHKAK
jgi:hypothetical protein